MTKTPQRRGRSHLRGGQNKNKGIGVENIRWSAVILTGVVLLALLSAVMLYSSYYLGGRSIYLMRRLPDGRQTLRRQVWTAPLVWAVCAVAAAAVVLGLCYLAWRFITPEQCIPTAENIQRVMNAIAASPYSHYYG